MKKSDVVETMLIIPRDGVKYLMGAAAKLNTEMCTVCPGIGFQGEWAYSLNEDGCAAGFKLPWNVCGMTEIPDVDLKLYKPHGIDDGLVEGTISIPWLVIENEIVKRFKKGSFKVLKFTVSEDELSIVAFTPNRESRVVTAISGDFSNFPQGSIGCSFEDFHSTIKNWPQNIDPESDPESGIQFLIKPDLCRIFWTNVENTLFGSVPEVRQ